MKRTLSLALLIIFACGCANQEGAPPETALSPEEKVRRDSIEAAVEQERIRLQPCMDAFQAAASVSDVRDTHSDLFPAYFACSNLDDWKKADSRFPNALDGADPIVYARNVCGNTASLEDSPVCNAVSEDELNNPDRLSQCGEEPEEDDFWCVFGEGCWPC